MTILRYILLFFFYSAAGWAVESLYRSIGEKRLLNSGFLTGPMCPIYGTGALVMTVFLYNPFKDKPLLVFVLGMIICDAVEYITSFLMEILFNQHWWDYTYEFCNLKGRICLKHTLYWGVGSVAFTQLIHPGVDKIISGFDDKLVIELIVGIFIIFIIDVAHAVSKALDIRSLQAKINSFTDKIPEPIKEAIDTVGDTVNAIGDKIYDGNDKINLGRQEIYNQAESLIKAIEERLAIKTFKDRVFKHLYINTGLRDNAEKQLEKLKKIRDSIKAGLSDSEEKK